MMMLLSLFARRISNCDWNSFRFGTSQWSGFVRSGRGKLSNRGESPSFYLVVGHLAKFGILLPQYRLSSCSC
jgi:hypothetical protein